jgi:hypothetical protein
MAGRPHSRGLRAIGADLDQLLAQAVKRPRSAALGSALAYNLGNFMWMFAWSWRRTALAAKVRNDSRVH